MSNTVIKTDFQEEIDALLDDVAIGKWSIVLYNDEINTFDWVISCLIKYCEHDKIQAEQCAWFVHTKGKYAVKTGSKGNLKPICQTLCEKGLSAVLEKQD